MEIINISIIGVFIIVNVLVTEGVKTIRDFIQALNEKPEKPKYNRFLPLVFSIPLAFLYGLAVGNLSILFILQNIFIITAGANSSYDLILKKILGN